MPIVTTKTTTLSDKLAEELSKIGVQFRVDSWKNEAPNNYGVVEMVGQDKGEWADGHMIDQTFTVEITLYVGGGSVKWVQAVQEKLEAMDAGYTLPERRWLPDIKKTMWFWKATFYGPFEWSTVVAVGG